MRFLVSVAVGGLAVTMAMTVAMTTMAVPMACMIVEQDQAEEIAQQANTTDNQHQLWILNDY